LWVLQTFQTPVTPEIARAKTTPFGQDGKNPHFSPNGMGLIATKISMLVDRCMPIKKLK